LCLVLSTARCQGVDNAGRLAWVCDGPCGAWSERWDSFGVGVEPFQREAVFDPVLLAAAVHGDGRVAELFEALGDGVAAGAIAGAVDDDRRLPVGQQRPCQSVDVAWGDVDGAGEVGVGVVRSAEGFY